MNAIYPARLLLGRAVLAALAAGCLAWSGCASMNTAARIPSDAVAALSPAPEVATPYHAVENAKAYVKEHPGSDFAIGSGDSMMPLYRDRDVIILERPALSKLRVGQTVMFMGNEGVPVAHILVARKAGGWVTMGMNNAETDPGTLRDCIYMGVVVKAYRPTGSPILAYWKTSPENMVAAIP